MASIVNCYGHCFAHHSACNTWRGKEKAKPWCFHPHAPASLQYSPRHMLRRHLIAWVFVSLLGRSVPRDSIVVTNRHFASWRAWLSPFVADILSPLKWEVYAQPWTMYGGEMFGVTPGNRYLAPPDGISFNTCRSNLAASDRMRSLRTDKEIKQFTSEANYSAAPGIIRCFYYW